MWGYCVLLLAVFSGCLGRSVEENGASVAVPEVLHVLELNKTTADPSTAGERIVGGQDTNIQRFPYTVQVQQSNQLICGGSLLTSRTVLSAAHCFFDTLGNLLSASLFSIRAGSALQNSGGQTHVVTKIVPHERYNVPILRDNDIAVLVLRTRVTVSASVGFAAIPGQSNIVPDGASVIHVGWGRTDPNTAVLSNTLKEVTVYVVNQNTCANNYNYLGTYLGMPGQFPVTGNMMCAGVLGVGGRDACTGDSGGPLIYNGVVVGVTSWGFSCAEPYYPGVSARVSSYTSWINATVQANSVGTIKASAVIAAVASLLSALLR